MLLRMMPVVLAAIVVAVWYPPGRWYALGFLVPLALVLLFSAAIRIHKLRHPETDAMDESTEILQDLREAAGWLAQLWP